jgi:hypothetical protein
VSANPHAVMRLLRPDCPYYVAAYVLATIIGYRGKYSREALARTASRDHLPWETPEQAAARFVRHPQEKVHV